MNCKKTIDKNRSIFNGIKNSLMFAPGLLAFGLVYGIIARQAGFNPFDIWLMSAMVHAGSSQFSVLGIWQNAGILTILIVTLAVNARHILMGLSIAPYTRDLNIYKRLFLALWMCDESYGLGIKNYLKNQKDHMFFLGANIGIFLQWTLYGLIGGLFAGIITEPQKYGLDLIFPLAFIGLLSNIIKDLKGFITALIAGLLTFLLYDKVPLMGHLIISAVIASTIMLSIESSKWKNT